MSGLAKKFIYGPAFRTIYRVFIKEVKGTENLPLRGGYILAANHSSYLDIPSLSFSIYKKIGKEVRYIAKKELFYNPFSRYIMETGNVIPIDREKKDEGAFEKAIEALKNGEIIGIYPEGTRTLTGKIQKGKTGVARLALWAKVPVVPVGIKGTFEIMPKGKIIPNIKKNVEVIIGKPIYVNKYQKQKITKRFLRKITNNIMENIENLLR